MKNIFLLLTIALLAGCTLFEEPKISPGIYDQVGSSSVYRYKFYPAGNYTSFEGELDSNGNVLEWLSDGYGYWSCNDGRLEFEWPGGSSKYKYTLTDDGFELDYYGFPYVYTWVQDL